MDGPEIFIPIIGILVGGMAIIIPIAGLTAHFELKPLVDSWKNIRPNQADDRLVRSLEARLAVLEDQVQALAQDNVRLLEDAEFRLQLASSD